MANIDTYSWFLDHNAPPKPYFANMDLFGYSIDFLLYTVWLVAKATNKLKREKPWDMEPALTYYIPSSTATKSATTTLGIIS
jgi:hypothetical protein